MTLTGVNHLHTNDIRGALPATRIALCAFGLPADEGFAKSRKRECDGQQNQLLSSILR
jgi:hypothetical protein